MKSCVSGILAALGAAFSTRRIARASRREFVQQNWIGDRTKRFLCRVGDLYCLIFSRAWRARGAPRIDAEFRRVAWVNVVRFGRCRTRGGGYLGQSCAADQSGDHRAATHLDLSVIFACAELLCIQTRDARRQNSHRRPFSRPWRFVDRCLKMIG